MLNFFEDVKSNFVTDLVLYNSNELSEMPRLFLILKVFQQLKY